MKDMKVINIDEKMSLFSDVWHPRIVGELNDVYVKVVRFQGEFDWHSHEKEDELFWVTKGEFDLHLRDKVLKIKAGEFIIVPHGIEHKPIAEKEVEVILIEPRATINTGELKNERTLEKLEWI